MFLSSPVPAASCFNHDLDLYGEAVNKHHLLSVPAADSRWIHLSWVKTCVHGFTKRRAAFQKEVSPPIDPRIKRPWAMCCKIDSHVWLDETDNMTYDCLSNEQGQQRHSGKDGMFSRFVMETRGKWVQPARENHSEVSAGRPETPDMEVLKSRASPAATSAAAQCVTDTRKHEMCYWSGVREMWRRLTSSTRELVKWSKPITVCDHELRRESESRVGVFFPAPAIMWHSSHDLLYRRWRRGAS